MTTDASHYGDEMHELLDKRLNANVRRAVEAHVDSCAGCRRELDAIAWVRQVVRLMPATRASDKLRRRVLGAVRTERVDVERLSHRHAPLGFRTPLVIAFLVLAGLAAILAYQFRGKPDSLAGIVSHDYRAVRSGELKLDVRTDDPAALGAYFKKSDVPFPVRIYARDSTTLELVGGGVIDPGPGIRTIVVYRDPRGEMLVSQSFIATGEGLPAGSVVHELRGARLHSFYMEGATAVCWEEGPVVRSLASDLPLNQLLEIAATQARP